MLRDRSIYEGYDVYNFNLDEISHCKCMKDFFEATCGLDRIKGTNITDYYMNQTTIDILHDIMVQNNMGKVKYRPAKRNPSCKQRAAERAVSWDILAYCPVTDNDVECWVLKVGILPKDYDDPLTPKKD